MERPFVIVSPYLGKIGRIFQLNSAAAIESVTAVAIQGVTHLHVGDPQSQVMRMRFNLP